MEERLYQFALTLLRAEMPVGETYQECMSLAHAIHQQSGSNLFDYKLAPGVMEQSAQAVLAAKSALREEEEAQSQATLARYREEAERRRQEKAPTSNSTDWAEWEGRR